MTQIIRCPLTAEACSKTMTPEGKAFFLAEPAEPELDRKRRDSALKMALQDQYRIRTALEEKELRAFTCKICEMIQCCSYGIADITEENPNVILELGMMMALGKPVVILRKKEQKQRLELPADLRAIEVILFEEYIDIVEPLKAMIAKLPLPVSARSPIEEAGETIKKFAPGLTSQVEDFKKALDEARQKLALEFQRAMREAKIDRTTHKDGEEVKISTQLEQRLGRLEQSLKELGKIGFITDAQTAFLRGNFYHRERNFLAALSQYNWSLSLRPDHTDTLTERGRIYHHLGRREEALADYSRSLELRPNDPETFASRGMVYVHLERYAEALSDFNHTLELRPDHPDTLYNMACLFSLWKKPDNALNYLKRSIAGDKKYVKMAVTDKDFDNIRDTPRFKKLVGG